VTLEIVKIHVSESEHRVAHLLLSNLCKEFPNDPHLWENLGKIYLDIGKRQYAVDAFKKSQELLSQDEKIPQEIKDANKFFDLYFFCFIVENIAV